MSADPLVMDPTGIDIEGEAARIAERGPVTLVELPGGVRAWAVSNTKILKSLLRSSDVSKDARQHWPAFINGEVGPDWPLYTWVAVKNMFTAYGKDHTRLRKLATPAFTARRTREMRPRIEAIVADQLEKLAALPTGQIVDLRELYAYPIPIQVISELMGVPDKLNPALRTCVDGVFDTSLTPEEEQNNFTTMIGVLNELVEYRHANPSDDLTTALIAVRDEEGDEPPLNHEELVFTLLLMISAGHETTVNLIDQSIYTLLTKPDLRATMISGDIDWSDMVEEALRYYAPVSHLPLRYAVNDIEVGGVKITKGEAILASYIAANRDPELYGPTANDFDPTREIKEHMAFGYGAHHCLGAPLGRLEATIALPALFERFPDMRLATTDLTPVSSFISNGNQTLPVYLTGEGNEDKPGFWRRLPNFLSRH